jgi:hypothetical protein
MRNTGVCSVHTHNNGMHGVHSIDRAGILLVHTQCGYMLSHNSLINGAREYWCTVGAY